MRDLINLIDYLAEDQTLSPSTLTKETKRFDRFLEMIRKGIPLYTVDRTPVIIDPSEADRFEQMFNSGTFQGTIKLKLKTGEELPLGKFLKTSDFGGQASTGQEEEEIGKETALLKPSQIGITDKDIPAAELGDEIINNTVLQSTDYGKIVIQMAQTIMNRANPVIPKEIPSRITDSIIDYAGEYLGVLALVQGLSRFPRKNSFEKWLGADVGSLVINFPSKANTNIADSYASIKNAKTAHKINISSKGKGGGAPPSVGGLKIPDDIRNNSEYEASVAFIDLCDSSKLPKYNLPEPKTISQVFQAMNLLYQYVPESIPEKFNQFLPWKIDIVGRVVDSMNEFKKRKNLPLSEYESIWSDIKFKKPSSDGGKLTHAVKLAVMEAVNEGRALPDFQEVILAILNMNFIQQYTDFDTKSRTMRFATQWPGKLEGKITLESKSGATDPTKGGFSFKLSNTDPVTDLEQPNELGIDTNKSKSDEVPVRKPGEKLKVIGKEVEKEKSDTEKDQDAGRRRRR